MAGKKIKRYEYLRKVYDNESSLDYDLSKLGLVGWLMCGIVRYNPSPARVQYMVWFARELGREENVVSSTKFTPPSAPVIGEGVPRVMGDPLKDPVNWPDLVPDDNPFDDLEIPGLDDED